MSNKALDCALRLLLRRDHGAQELLLKLQQKGFAAEEASQALAECQRLGYQNDQRFVEMVCHARINQGYGPIKITHELQSKHIDKDLIDAAIEAEHENWPDYALQVWKKKFNQKPSDFSELQKQQRFLLYRGFPVWVINKVVKDHELF